MNTRPRIFSALVKDLITALILSVVLPYFILQGARLHLTDLLGQEHAATITQGTTEMFAAYFLLIFLVCAAASAIRFTIKLLTARSRRPLYDGA